MKGRRRICLLLAAAFLLTGCAGDVPASAEARMEEGKKYVALTFDDGPRANTTGRLLDGLRERGASATFFLIGRQIAGNEDLLLRMRDEGHQVGNHTWDHVDLQGASRAAVDDQLGRTDAAVRAVLGDGDYWVRPPYGLLNPNQLDWFSTPLVHWSVDPEDWKLLNAEKVAGAVLKAVKPGDIILLHDFYATSVDAALAVVDALEAQGYEFVTVKELLTLQGVEPECGTFYQNAEKIRITK